MKKIGTKAQREMKKTGAKIMVRKLEKKEGSPDAVALDRACSGRDVSVPGADRAVRWDV
jgi:hypothetical protein